MPLCQALALTGTLLRSAMKPGNGPSREEQPTIVTLIIDNISSDADYIET